MFAGPFEFSFFFLSRFLLFPCLFAFCTAFFFQFDKAATQAWSRILDTIMLRELWAPENETAQCRVPEISRRYEEKLISS